MAKLKVAGFAKNSTVDGPGIRYTIFAQGCYHNCIGCHNQQTHDPNWGYFVDIEDIYKEILESTMYSGVTFSGGEPFLQADALTELANKIKSNPDNELDIICYTGFTYEEILQIIKDGCFSYSRLLSSIDYLIDGQFEQDKASLDCLWRGSTNQRIIDVKESLKTNSIVETEL